MGEERGREKERWYGDKTAQFRTKFLPTIQTFSGTHFSKSLIHLRKKENRERKNLKPNRGWSLHSQ